MFETELKLAAMNLGQLRALLQGVSEAQFRTKANGRGHTPAWIVGHLAVTLDFALTLLGRPPLCPPEWAGLFGPGSREDTAPPVSMAELVGAFVDGHAAVEAAARAAEAGALERPHGVPFLEGTPARTVRDVVALLITTHEAGHLGQLSAWRRQVGFDPLF